MTDRTIAPDPLCECGHPASEHAHNSRVGCVSSVTLGCDCYNSEADVLRAALGEAEALMAKFNASFAYQARVAADALVEVAAATRAECAGDTARLDWLLWDQFGAVINGYDVEDMAFRELVADGRDEREPNTDADAFRPLYCKHGRIAIDAARPLPDRSEGDAVTPTREEPPVPAETPAPLPCPWCGGTRLWCGGTRLCEETNGSSVWMACLDCSAEGPFVENARTEDEALAAWNRRAAPRVERDWPPSDRETLVARALSALERISDEAGHRVPESPDGYDCEICRDFYTVFAALRAPDAPQECLWSADDWEMAGFYETSCGHALEFTTGNATENEAKFCQYCGKPIREERITREPDDDEDDAALRAPDATPHTGDTNDA